MKPVRVRFAPSPTGLIHIGNIRTALFNWLYARHAGGTMVLRIEDTDEARSADEFIAEIADALRWLGLDWDEGPDVGGPFGPYKQMDRLARYQEVAADLLARGLAYEDASTPAELAAVREACEAEGRPPRVGPYLRAVPSEETARRKAAGAPVAIRFRMPDEGEVVVADLVHGEIRFPLDAYDDFVILRASGVPTYQLANPLDDLDMQITHVIRGEDLLSSTPRQVVLAEALGRPEPAIYAHLPLIVGADRKKLSKRHGEAALRWYSERGYLPAAVRNFLALLGWGPPGEEKLSLDELVEQFDLSGVTRSAAIFDPVKLDWLNGVYIRDLPPDEFASIVRRAVIDADLVASGETDRLAVVEAAAPLVQERVRLLAEVAEMVGWLVVMPPIPPALFEKVYVAAGAGDRVRRARATLDSVDPWDGDSIGDALKAWAKESEGVSFAKVQAVVRVAVSGAEAGIPLFESLALLGREETLARLDAVIALLR